MITLKEDMEIMLLQRRLKYLKKEGYPHYDDVSTPNLLIELLQELQAKKDEELLRIPR